MGFFDSIRTGPKTHMALGGLVAHKGRWRGHIDLEGTRALLFLPGSRSGPDPLAIETANKIGDWWIRSRPDVERELFEHFDASREAEVPDLPDIKAAGDVWAHVTVRSVEITPYDSMNEIQVALGTAWDQEHTLGALIHDGDFVDLNGSILEPR